jgi:glycosyltransferase involved in cell wall biosynthesis
MLKKLNQYGDVKVTVAIVTYKRAWALPYSLSSIAEQTRPPDEVVIVLKPSGDGSEEVIAKYSEKLPIRTIIQREGNFTDAVQMAIDNARGDSLIFIDDDAVAEPQLVEKYLRLFSAMPDAGGISGEAYTAYLDNGLKKTYEKI